MIKDKRKTAAVILTAVPVIAVMGAIFYFSSQTAEASTVTSGGFVETFMQLITEKFGELNPEAYVRVENTVTFIVRKAAHFLEFAALGFFLMLHLRLYVKKLPWLWSFGISVLYAASDEFHQHFVSERAPQLRDVFVDAFGAACGILGICLMLYIIGKIIKRKTEDSKNKSGG